LRRDVCLNGHRRATDGPLDPERVFLQDGRHCGLPSYLRPPGTET
jgi:hypothetical protein